MAKSPLTSSELGSNLASHWMLFLDFKIQSEDRKWVKGMLRSETKQDSGVSIWMKADSFGNSSKISNTSSDLLILW